MAKLRRSTHGLANKEASEIAAVDNADGHETDTTSKAKETTTLGSSTAKYVPFVVLFRSLMEVQHDLQPVVRLITRTSEKEDRERERETDRLFVFDAERLSQEPPIATYKYAVFSNRTRTHTINNRYKTQCPNSVHYLRVFRAPRARQARTTTESAVTARTTNASDQTTPRCVSVRNRLKTHIFTHDTTKHSKLTTCAGRGTPGSNCRPKTRVCANLA